MSSVKELLRKLINEEIEKLEEQSRWGNWSNQDLLKRLRKLDADASAAGGIDRVKAGQAARLFGRLLKVNKYVIDHFPNAWKALETHQPKSAALFKQKAAELQGIPKTKEDCPIGQTKDNTGKCVPVKSEFRPPEDGQPDAGQKAALAATRPSAKGKGAVAGKDVAKRKPRKPNKTMAHLQSMLYYTLVGAGVKKPYFMGKSRFGSGYAPGADGIYGGKTQGAIDALRKTDKNAPKRQGSFKKSVRALVDYLKGAGKGTAAGKAKPQAAGKAKPQAAGKAKPQGAAKAPGLDLAKTIDSFSMKHGGGVFGKWIKAARKKGVSDEKIMNTIKGATANNIAWRAAYKNLKALSGRVDESKSPLKPLTMKDTMESFREHLNESEVEEAMPGVPTKVEREEYKRETAGSADFVDTGDLRNALGENFNDLQIVDPASYPDVMAFTNSTSNDKLLPLKRTEDGTIYFKINDYGGGSYMKIKV